MSAELALAVIGTIDLGFKWGQKILQLCATFKDAPKEIFERGVRVEACWMRISAQLDFSRRTADLMDENHRTLHGRTLDILIDKLQAVHRELNWARDNKAETHSAEIAITAQPRVENNGTTAKRIRYALKKKSIDEAIHDLEAWQGIFDISWLLTLRIANRNIDDALAKSTVSRISASMPPTTQLRAAIRMDPSRSKESVFLHESGLQRDTIASLPCCDACIAMRKDEVLILDRIECSEAATRTVIKDVRRLATSMREAPSGADSFGWLKCKGIVKEVNTPKDSETPPTTALVMVFKVPSGYIEPMSLRAALLQGEMCLESLSEKVKLAQDLARAVSYVHIFGFVHKNIRPETILLLRQDNNGSCPSSTGSKGPLSLFLVGFDKFRSEDGITHRVGDKEWAKGLYRHPRRQGLRPEDVYIMQHDIYSLGVCLLEIGLWESFAQYDDIRRMVTGGADILNDPSTECSTLPLQAHARLLALADSKLPRCMGSKYSEVVKTCLTCLDRENVDFRNGSEFCDEDGIVVGVRYVEKVIMKLKAISV